LIPIEKIIFVRKQMGYTQAEFAAKIGRTLDAIKNIENGRTPVKKDILKAISDFTKIPVQSFTTGTITSNSIKFTKLTEEEFNLRTSKPLDSSNSGSGVFSLTVRDLVRDLSLYPDDTIVGLPEGFNFYRIRNNGDSKIAIEFREIDGVDYILKDADEELVSRDMLTEQTKMLHEMLKEKDKIIADLHELIGELKHRLSETENLKNKPRITPKTPRNYK